MIDTSFLEMLACPACKSELRSEGDFLACKNVSCQLQYPVRDGIPVMIIDEAKKKNT